jgi:hypothetical protein
VTLPFVYLCRCGEPACDAAVLSRYEREKAIALNRRGWRYQPLYYPLKGN